MQVLLYTTTFKHLLYKTKKRKHARIPQTHKFNKMNFNITRKIKSTYGLTFKEKKTLRVKIGNKKYFSVLQTSLGQRLNFLRRIIRNTLQHPFRKIGGDFKRTRRFWVTKYKIKNCLQKNNNCHNVFLRDYILDYL